MKIRHWNCLVIAVAAALAGCQPQAAPPAAGAPPATPAPSPSAAVPGEAPAAQATEQVAAKAGVGIQGQSLEGHSGILVEPAKAFFRFKQNVVFDIQIPQALQLFEATEGRKPKSQDEFMTRVVQANNINLPRLPDGHKYLYDTASGELKVERPAK